MASTLTSIQTLEAQSTRQARDLLGERYEYAWLALILLVFLFVNVFTADHYPFPFCDEVILAEPAVNYITGHGFATAVRIENSPAFYFGNVPAHPGLLIPWLKVFGISMRSVRSINFVYMAMMVLLVWSATKRIGLVVSARWRLLLVSMLMCDYSMILSYRSGRYDCLGMLVLAFALWNFSFRAAPLRLTALTIAGAASPWIGLQLLPLEAALGAMLFAFTLFRYWREILVFFVGVVVGGLGLIRFFTSHGVLKYFLGFIHSQSEGPRFVVGLFHGQFRHFNVLPKDFSLPLVLGSAVLLATVLYSRNALRSRSLLMYGLTFVPLFSLALIVLAKFPTYYGWMTFIPLAIAVCGSLDLDLPTRVRKIAVTLCILASAVGVGLHLLACARDWNDRDYSKVQEFVKSSIGPDDWAFVDPQAYYPAKLTGAAIFFPDPGSRQITMSSTQKNRLTVCVIGPERAWVLKQLGGTWYRTGQEMIPKHVGLFGNNNSWGFLSLPNYRLAVYRRVPIAHAEERTVVSFPLPTKRGS